MKNCPDSCRKFNAKYYKKVDRLCGCEIDSQIVEYLNCTNFDPDKCVVYLRSAYKTIMEMPQLFVGRDITNPEALRFWEVVNMAIFPKKSKDGYKIVYFGLRDPDPSHFNTVWSMKMYIMSLEAIVRSADLVPAYVFILDGKGMSFSHTPISQLRFLKRSIGFLQECSLVNMKTIHFINASTMVERSYSVLKPFLNVNVTESLNFYSDGKMLATVEDPAALPPELGGTLSGTIEQYKENHIIVYLRACKFSLEKTKDAIDLNFTLRTRCPEFFSNRHVNTLTKTIKNLDIMLMPERDNDGNVVICYRLKPMDLSEWSYAGFTKLSMMSQDACNWELGSAPGYVFVHDIKNLTFSQIIQSPISQIAASLKYSQEASACSIRGIHILNGGTIFEKLFTVIKPFLNQEVIDVMKVHSNFDNLISAVGAQAVPKDFGGNGPSINEGNDEMVKLINKYQDALMEEEKFRVDEKRRPEGNKAGDFGIQGSFRKIEVD